MVRCVHGHKNMPPSHKGSGKMEPVTMREARANFSDVANEVQFRGERIVVHRHGKPAFAIVSVEDLELLQALEDRMDLEAAREAVREMEAAGEKPIPWSKVKKKLGL